MEWAYKEGITGGKTKTLFAPNDSCTRAQMMTFLWIASGEPEPQTAENPFKDVPEAYYAKPVAWAYENGITSGKTKTTFGPDDPCTRAQIVTFLYLLFME